MVVLLDPLPGQLRRRIDSIRCRPNSALSAGFAGCDEGGLSDAAGAAVRRNLLADWRRLAISVLGIGISNS